MEEQRPAAAGQYRFGVFEFDAGRGELRKSGRVVSLRPQPMRLLQALVTHPGELVTRDELKRALWSDETFVDFDQGLNHAVRELRAALGDAAESPRFVQTLQRRGYRFIAPVEQVSGPGSLPERVGTVTTPVDLTVASSVKRLRALLLLTAAALAAAALYFGLAARSASSHGVPTSIVVRPFESPEDPTLGAGIARVIADRLGLQQHVTIQMGTAGSRPSTSAGFSLDGGLSKRGSEVVARVRLHDATGGVVWQDDIRVRADELFSLEDVVAERVVNALRLQLASEEQARLRRRYTNNADAYADYLRGRAELVQYTPEGTLGAVAAFERALAGDPSYALARAGLAMASADMYLRFAPEREVERWGERADTEARAALESDAELAEAHLARAAVARKREFDWNATVSSSRRALALNPNLDQADQAHYFIAAAYYHNGYMEEARIEMQKGRARHGIDHIEPRRIEGLIALFSGNFVAATGHLEEVSRLASKPIGDTYLALAQYYTGSADRARTTLDSLASGNGSASTATRAGAALASVLAAESRLEEARSWIRRVLAHGYRDHHVAYSLGAAYAQLGDYDGALRWLRTAADSGFACVPFYQRDPLLEPLRRRSEFAALIDYVRARRAVALASATD
jgi:DNA-binding winged helix-turn-helix (wHTH) protein/tetratricopeptide (TPR) repeat protein